MGTRASFFINDPENLETRQWLGCIAFDGYPDGDCQVLAEATTEGEFRAMIATLAKERNDFCDPAVHGFPFPWQDDLFLTDYTYAWIDGRVMATSFHTGWILLHDLVHGGKAIEEAYSERRDELPHNVAAPAKWDRSAPDSIIIIGAR